METIMLACAGGMSSSLLVTRMKKAMVKRNLEYNIFATGVDAIPDDYRKSHPVVILIGPQVSYMLAKVRQEVDVPVEVIVSKNYGMMDGDKVLDQALKMMQ
jgi:Phosphotransferase system cellobiose-specific component IIB